MKRDTTKLIEYIAGFLSNLGVAGMALAIFKADEAITALIASVFSVVLGGILLYFNGGNKK